jgi:hypothetical protein
MTETAPFPTPVESEVFDELSKILSEVQGQPFERRTWRYTHRGPRLSVIFEYTGRSLNVIVTVRYPCEWANTHSMTKLKEMTSKWQIQASSPSQTARAFDSDPFMITFLEFVPDEWPETRFKLIVPE